jgi:RNase P/RNase MRP subunit POP5
MKKERVRYINIRFIGPLPISEKDAWFLVATEVKRLYGVIGAAEVGLYLSFFDSENQSGIFRTAHNSVHLVRGAICYIHTHRSQTMFVYSDNLTGSLKKAKERLESKENRKCFEKIKLILEKSVNSLYDE